MHTARCNHLMNARVVMYCAIVQSVVASLARADVDPNSGIDFVRVGAVGNAPWQGDGTVGDRAVGRGGVNYEYSIGRFEVTTAQWAEFFNAAYDRPAGDSIPFLLTPQFWGAVPTAPTTTGNPNARRWRVPTGNEMIPTGDITWRTAAILCNWLQNDKRTDRAAFMSGAYDVSTFGYTAGTNQFTDQQAHSPGARYWIPTWDEWLKAAHYDPNKLNGDGTRGGWWQYSNGSDTPYVYGPPGTVVNGQPAQANAGFISPSPFSIPLASYPTVQSPWGLLDVAGGTYEWTESIRTINDGTMYRFVDGSGRGDDAFQASVRDRIREYGGEFPHIADFAFGLRLASNVPAPASCVLGAGALIVMGTRRRRRFIGDVRTPRIR